MHKKTHIERKKAKTKDKIFDAAVKLFLAQGYENTTVDQIAAKAEVAKGTFFNYFPTKDAIIYYLGEQRVNLMQDMLENELREISSAKEKIYAWIEMLGSINEQYKEITGLIMNVGYTKLFFQPKTDWDTQFLFRDILADVIAEGQQQGELRKEFEPKYAADILMSIYFSVLFQWFEGYLDKSLTEEFICRVEIVMAGITVIND